jgi:1-acyl-sn-glycerol-3-phosphate acyltransferase
VVPTAMIGGFEFQPAGKIAPQLRIRPGVRFGKPLDFSRYYGLEEDRIVLRAMTDEIMYELMKLSGQEYVDEYAQRSKGRLPTLRKANPDLRVPPQAPALPPPEIPPAPPAAGHPPAELSQP